MIYREITSDESKSAKFHCHESTFAVQCIECQEYIPFFIKRLGNEWTFVVADHTCPKEGDNE